MDSVSLNDMPYEVLYNIYSKVCQCNSPLLNYRIRFVNQSFRDIVNNYDGKVCRHINDSDLDKNLLYIRGNIEIYKWLYNHRVFIEYTDVFHLINNNRNDVLKLAEKYVNNKDVLFNRFYLSDGYSNEKFNIFNFGTINRSFLLLACEINNLEIVKFFLESLPIHLETSLGFRKTFKKPTGIVKYLWRISETSESRGELKIDSKTSKK